MQMCGCADVGIADVQLCEFANGRMEELKI
jgi:hypothetical protein